MTFFRYDKIQIVTRLIIASVELLQCLSYLPFCCRETCETLNTCFLVWFEWNPCWPGLAKICYHLPEMNSGVGTLLSGHILISELGSSARLRILVMKIICANCHSFSCDIGE